MIRIITSKRLKELEEIEKKHLTQQIAGSGLLGWLSVVIPEYPAIWAYIKEGCNAPDRFRDELRRIQSLKSKSKINTRLDRLEDNLLKGFGVNTTDWTPYLDENGKIDYDKDFRKIASEQRDSDE